MENNNAPSDLRLAKALARAGIASRRKCEELIFKGKVMVNDQVVLLPQTKVNLVKDKITVDDVPVSSPEEKVYFILNKPKGYICSNLPLKGKKLVIDLFKHLGLRLFTVGRLDRDTTGLLIITNDGEFAHNVIHPSKKVSKEYLVKTVQEIEAAHLEILARGGMVEGCFVKPISVKKVRKGTVKIVVREGKKREVRALVQKAKLDLLSLSRIRIGNLTLGNLEVGEFRPLSSQERSALLGDNSTFSDNLA